MADRDGGFIVSAVNQIPFAGRPPRAVEPMHFFGGQKIWQTVAYAFIGVFGHHDFVGCWVQGSVEQVAIAYIAHQVATGTWIEAAVSMVFGRNTHRSVTLR